MNTKEVADRLVELCRVGKWDVAQAELYCPNCKSIEPREGFGPKEIQGMDAIKKKGEVWSSMLEEFHGAEISDPIVAGNHFALTMKMDCTFKEGGRQQSEEVCVYEVKDGKITSEEFFYAEGN